MLTNQSLTFHMTPESCESAHVSERVKQLTDAS